ncbi:unnamed protein product [Ilex paraguariensis]|uniref:Uncharacterized protein n=1 Tax=Ilex paraguariensis TaxID=185542 RepID=A0ABC8UUT0_9AQUA
MICYNPLIANSSKSKPQNLRDKKPCTRITNTGPSQEHKAPQDSSSEIPTKPSRKEKGKWVRKTNIPNREESWNIIEKPDGRKRKWSDVQRPSDTTGLIVDSHGRAGGLALLWHRDVNVSVKSFSNFPVEAIIDENTDDQWRLWGSMDIQ